MKYKISEYGLYITKTVYYEVSCGVVVGSVMKATWTGVGILQLFGRNSHSDATFNFCPNVRLHWLPRLRVRYLLPR